MCGFIQRDRKSPTIQSALTTIGLDFMSASITSGGAVERFYPAFGGNTNRIITGLILQQEEGITAVDATWWFDCKEVGGELVAGDRTTFNARNLDSPYWKGAFRRHRAVVVATAFGESQQLEGKKHQYLMTGHKQAILLGAVYRPFPSGHYACAVITRPAHTDFAKYHEKAMPLMLPHDKDFIAEWLQPGIQTSAAISRVIEDPVIYPPLAVQHVESFKSAKVINEEGLLRS